MGTRTRSQTVEKSKIFTFFLFTQNVFGSIFPPRPTHKTSLSHPLSPLLLLFTYKPYVCALLHSRKQSTCVVRRWSVVRAGHQGGPSGPPGWSEQTTRVVRADHQGGPSEPWRWPGVGVLVFRVRSG